MRPHRLGLGRIEVTKDLIKTQLDGGPPLPFEVLDVVPEEVDGESPQIRFTDADNQQVLECDVIAGTDGFHGVSRPVVQQGTGGKVWERTYPYAWLGILADAAPATDEPIYAWHPEGFGAVLDALAEGLPALPAGGSRREDRGLVRRPDLENLAKRFALDGWELNTGTITEKSVLLMRSFVALPRCGTAAFFLAGDAAHIVPPTGAKA